MTEENQQQNQKKNQREKQKRTRGPGPIRRGFSFLSRIARMDKELPETLQHVWLVVIPLVALLGSIYVFVYGCLAPGTAYVIGTALMFGAAAFLAGGLVGFLFGVPKGASGDAAVGTQLEQISTWLATIVVGLTLSQLGRIPGALGKLADIMKPALGDQPSSGEFGVALVIFYAILGFLFLYLWTRALLVNELDPQQAAANAKAAKVHTAPLLADLESTPLNYVAGTAPVAVASTLTVSSPDATTLASATVSISAGLVTADDSLGFTSPNGITGSYTASTGVLKLTGTAPLADYQTALRSVTYPHASSSPTPGTRTISILVNDGSSAENVSNVVSRTVSVTAAAVE